MRAYPRLRRNSNLRAMGAHDRAPQGARFASRAQTAAACPRPSCRRSWPKGTADAGCGALERGEEPAGQAARGGGAAIRRVTCRTTRSAGCSDCSEEAARRNVHEGLKKLRSTWNAMKDLEKAAASRRAHGRFERHRGRRPARLAERAAHEHLLDVAYTTFDSPVGPVLVAATRRGLVEVSFGDCLRPGGGARGALRAGSRPRVVEAPSYFDAVRTELEEYFDGPAHALRPAARLEPHGRVRPPGARGSTAQIPYGEVSTYREVAATAGSPRGARAAGNALGANPIPIVVPCHRVLHSGRWPRRLRRRDREQGVPAEARGRPEVARW